MGNAVALPPASRQLFQDRCLSLSSSSLSSLSPSATPNINNDRTLMNLDYFLEREQCFVINNRCLSAVDIRKFRLQRKKLGQKEVRSFGIVYCYIVTPAVGGPYHREHLALAVLAEVTKLLEENPQLESVMLKGPFPRNLNDMNRLISSMNKFTNLREVAIGAWYLAQSHVPFHQGWIPLFQANRRLERLNLDSFDLSGNGQVSILNMVNALCCSSNMRSLGLRSCRITDAGLSTLVQSLLVPYLNKLDTLQLACNTTLTVEGLNSLAFLLELDDRVPLKSLDLVGNKTCFGQADGGTNALRFLGAIQRNRTLQNLSLVYCDVGDEFAQHLFQKLQANHTLKVLELDYNVMTREVGMVHCLEALPALHLEHLGICGLKRRQHPLGAGVPLAGMAHHRHHHHLRYRSLVDWRCCGQVCKPIHAALIQNASLLSFSLDSACCRQLCRDLLLRNQVTVMTRKLQSLPLPLYPLWMEHQHQRRPKRPWRCEDNEPALYLSSIYSVLHNKPLVAGRDSVSRNEVALA